ncbi:membrane protein required for colicin V production [Cyclobacterium lianum]|uniref:Membrane protein required for colicin V production n=2 Tax=Cyclobacterium lianum TaxID=388280 RepID=A0A1M7PQ79_9BACT|nr:membrane protein required for colicin V production [Cyclobacterium lianum]
MLAVGAFSGYRQGLFIGLLSILAFFIGIILAFRFMHWGAEILAERVESLTFMLPFAAFILIFLAVTISIRILAFMVKKALDLTILGTFDSFAGGILGIAKWSIMISLLIWVAHSFEFDVPEEMQQGSVIYPLVVPVAPTLVGLLDDYTPVIDAAIATIRELVNTAGSDPSN